MLVHPLEQIQLAQMLIFSQVQPYGEEPWNRLVNMLGSKLQCLCKRLDSVQVHSHASEGLLLAACALNKRICKAPSRRPFIRLGKTFEAFIVKLSEMEMATLPASKIVVRYRISVQMQRPHSGCNSVACTNTFQIVWVSKRSDSCIQRARRICA
jgi:hypothetical protein